MNEKQLILKAQSGDKKALAAGVNPQLTIMALSRMIAENIARKI